MMSSETTVQIIKRTMYGYNKGNSITVSHSNALNIREFGQLNRCLSKKRYIKTRFWTLEMIIVVPAAK